MPKLITLSAACKLIAALVYFDLIIDLIFIVSTYLYIMMFDKHLEQGERVDPAGGRARWMTAHEK